jgi:hypothetical protein
MRIDLITAVFHDCGDAAPLCFLPLVLFTDGATLLILFFFPIEFVRCWRRATTRANEWRNDAHNSIELTIVTQESSVIWRVARTKVRRLRYIVECIAIYGEACTINMTNTFVSKQQGTKKTRKRKQPFLPPTYHSLLVTTSKPSKPMTPYFMYG